ncbi:hypothetical protein Aph02nite_70380 [Actinoplanes philippinensis]|uniref:Uncharacterized protein n=1 Tax=Actinoplanes philippinensis TaxID=35752 RepID=A0A1I2JZD0_9ACTN|nr:hypothetical protein [Actinoplanes philippinensis]GIE81088.1 hypothetical protein Aph02nite_70380 [Actinoplanes philippinensis]SFF60282.1 hypothetical protein SAMN05421541_114275 [Actinoplanes philippinensis]
MNQYDPSAPGPRHSPGRPAGWPSEVPEPATVPTDWSPSGAYAGHHSTGVTPVGAPTAWDRAGSAPGWSGRHPEPDPAASWNGNTTMGPAYRGSHTEPTAWNGGYPAAHSAGPVPDRIPADWNSAPVPDSVPPSWHAEPPAATWNTDPEPIDLGVIPTRDEVRNHGRTTESPNRTARRNPKLMMAAALAAAALAGGGVGAGLMAAFGADTAATVPPGPGAGQPPNGQAPTTSPSKAT